ncbi:hypothetical protein AAFC00_001988 [Neodothiora populina]|uniref:Major facilitator superfamily (MFS) profile domain-containing protein n=1 Tax=Neodothiora populina TaxID=2781224 RepID=A0ABR3PG67_9PEZI
MDIKGTTPVVAPSKEIDEGGAYSPSNSDSFYVEDGEKVDYNAAELRKLLWKLDLRVLPPIFLLWFLSFIDRVNIGMARLGGLEKDLNMKGNDFNVALCIFFAPFILFEIPFNMILKKIKPSVWLPVQNFLLALFTIGEGVVRTKEGLWAMRFLVGFFEAGLVPGSIFLLSAYYARFDLQWRLNMLIVGNAVASAFGGLLAFAISSMSGEEGYLGWRWVFIIEGSVTAVVSLLCIFFVVSWPDEAEWLSDHERALIKTRIREQAGEFRMDRLDMAALKRCLLDWKVWLSTAIYIGTICSTYSISLFSPTIIKELNPHYSGRHVQILTVPIFIASAAVTLISAIASDKARHRYGFAMFGYLITLIGLAMFFAQEHLSPRALYGALFLISIGTYICLPLVWTMCVNNISGYWKNSIASALCVGFGNAGGIVASCIFVTKQAPHYWTGFRVDFGLTSAAAVLTTALLVGLIFENRKRARGGRDYRLERSADEVANLGDDHPRFRYVY